MDFDINKSKIARIVKIEKYFLFRLSWFFSIAFLVIFFVSFLFNIFSTNFDYRNLNEKTLGFSLISLSLAILFFLIYTFFINKIKNYNPGIDLFDAAKNISSFNIADFFSFEVAKVIISCIKYCKSKKIDTINSDILLYFVIRNNPKLNFVLSRALLNVKEIEEKLMQNIEELKDKNIGNLYSEEFINIILAAFNLSYSKKHKLIKIEDLFNVLVDFNDTFDNILVLNNLQKKDIHNLVDWLERIENIILDNKRFWSWSNLVKMGTLARHWNAGYTVLLDKFSYEIGDIVRRNGFPDVIGHSKEIENIERVLSQKESKNSVLLVGEPGSGRRSVVLGLCKKMMLGESLPELNYKRIVKLDLHSLISQFPESEIISVLDSIFKEVIYAGNVILFIDDFHLYLSPHRKVGSLDISEVLSPYLPLTQFQLIALTTYEGFHKNIESQTAILNLFEKIDISEVSQEETLLLLERFVLNLENKYKIFISYPALKEIILMCDKYLPSLAFPEKAMDVLDATVTYVVKNGEKIVLPKHVDFIIKEKTKIPVGEIETKERNILLNLEKFLRERVIGQEEAIKEIASALRRARANISHRSGPAGSFLFLGPTGVGKTETAKALADIYFGSEKRMIRLDMSEFQNLEDIKKLLGAPNQEGLLTTRVRENPFSLILLDEFEKANPNILNLFLQVFDEGHLTDGEGRKVDFRNNIIIATSNAGYQIIIDALENDGRGWANIKKKILDFIFSNSIFRPELINRFDAVVVFRPLTKENLLSISELLLNKIKSNLFLKGIEFVITPELKEKIVELSYSPIFGAREMRRVIQDKVENVLAVGILSNKLIKGSSVKINPENFTLEINTKS
jgi:ATP-dependent Clp protease ATP-binding subunit ClpC